MLAILYFAFCCGRFVETLIYDFGRFRFGWDGIKLPGGLCGRLIDYVPRFSFEGSGTGGVGSGWD